VQEVPDRGCVIDQIVKGQKWMAIYGKTALVTGGAHRVGGAITRMLAAAGARVAFTYHASTAEADMLLSELQTAGQTARALACDIADWQAVKMLSRQVEATLGPVEIIVNSASLFMPTPVPTDDISDWQRVSRVGIDGPFHICNAFVPGMLRQGQGAIVNILDNSIWKPWPDFAAHAMAKGALAALTRQLAVDLAPTVRVNGVVSGPVLPPTGMTSGRVDAIATQTLLKRWGRPEHVAHAVRYLIEAEYVTGEMLRVDGGERLARV
jgi:pteridine reductase